MCYENGLGSDDDKIIYGNFLTMNYCKYKSFSIELDLKRDRVRGCDKFEYKFHGESKKVKRGLQADYYGYFKVCPHSYPSVGWCGESILNVYFKEEELCQSRRLNASRIDFYQCDCILLGYMNRNKLQYLRQAIPVNSTCHLLVMKQTLVVMDGKVNLFLNYHSIDDNGASGEYLVLYPSLRGEVACYIGIGDPKVYLLKEKRRGGLGVNKTMNDEIDKCWKEVVEDKCVLFFNLNDLLNGGEYIEYEGDGRGFKDQCEGKDRMIMALRNKNRQLEMDLNACQKRVKSLNENLIRVKKENSDLRVAFGMPPGQESEQQASLISGCYSGVSGNGVFVRNNTKKRKGDMNASLECRGSPPPKKKQQISFKKKKLISVAVVQPIMKQQPKSGENQMDNNQSITLTLDENGIIHSEPPQSTIHSF